MNWKEYQQHLKEEWDFHCRNPEMFVVWSMNLGWFLYCVFWED